MVDPSYAESWLSQPDVCRCCLSASGTWDVTASYVTETGEKEVYSTMLLECYGITLSSLLQWGPSRMVCALCVSRLRDATNFRKQVLLADQQFITYCNSRPRVFKPVILKAETPNPKRDSSDSDDNSDVGTIDVLALTDSTDAAVVDRMTTKKKPVSKGKKRIPRTDVDDDLESDTAISEVSKKNHVPDSIDERTEITDDPVDKDSVQGAVVVPKKRKSIPYDEKRIVAERNIKNSNLRANISLVLKYTTVLPFKQINNNQFLCQYCDTPYLLFKDLKNHIKVRHWNITEMQIKRTIRCPKDLVKADVSDISCRLCGSNYNTIERLVEHLKGLHSKTFHVIPDMKHSHGILGFDLSMGKLKCAVCAKEFKFFKNLSVHMNEHDTDYICHICGKRFVAEHRLATHISRHRKLEFKCNHCTKKFNSASARDCHTRKKHKPLKYKCPECPQEFSQYLHRLRHMAERHKFKKPDFRCQYCSKPFAHHSALSVHIRNRHFKEESKKYVCEICDKTFSSNWLVKRHLVVHSGKKNFECEYCGKKYAKKYTLNVHVKTHFDDRQHACPLCQRAFVQKGSLIKHVKALHPNSGIDIKTL